MKFRDRITRFDEPRVHGFHAVSARHSNSQIVVDGLTVELLRKDIKNLHLRVYPPEGRVKVSMPINFPLEQAVEIIKKRTEWIKAQRNRLQSDNTQLRYDDGDEIWFFGEKFVLVVREGQKRPSVSLGDYGKITLAVSPNSDASIRQGLIERFYRKRLLEAALPLVIKWENILDVEVYELRTKKMTTRWGTCNVEHHRVWLSLSLALKSPKYLEYVIVHELAHLIERGHRERFKKIMDSALPTWRTLRKELNSPQ